MLQRQPSAESAATAKMSQSHQLLERSSGALPSWMRDLKCWSAINRKYHQANASQYPIRSQSKEYTRMWENSFTHKNTESKLPAATNKLVAKRMESLLINRMSRMRNDRFVFAVWWVSVTVTQRSAEAPVSVGKTNKMASLKEPLERAANAYLLLKDRPLKISLFLSFGNILSPW